MSGVRRSRARTARRGVLMLAVLVVLAVASLVAGGLLAASEAEHAGLAAMRDRTQQRAIAWSGCQAVASLLAGQRRTVADGDAPQVPDEVLLFEADGSQAVARLLPVGPAGETLVPEFSKFALAGLDPALLESTGVLDARAAAAAVSRGGHADAIEAIVAPDAGLTAQRVIGPVASGIAAGIRRLQSDAPGDRIAARVRPLAVADVATPFCAQRALGTASGAIAPRVPVAGWGDAAIAAIDARTSGGTGARMRDALGGKPPANQGDLVRAMRLAGVAPERWGAVLDAVVAGDAAVERGQVDVSSAPEEVLRAIPALGADRAARLVQARASLGDGERGDLSWPVTSGALTPEEFEAAAPMLCARSWLWRARIATGTIDDPAGDAQLRGIEVWEVVVDLAEDPPRFASLRDCTLLPVAVALADEERTRGEDRGDGARRAASDEDIGRVDAIEEPGEDPAMADAEPDRAYPGDGGTEARSSGGPGPEVPPDSGDRVPDAAPVDAPGTRGGPERKPAPGSRPWSSSASEASRRAEDRRAAEDAARRDKERAQARRRAGDSRVDAPADSASAPASGPAAASSREWKTLGERERQERESRAKEWSTLADRERAEREARRGAWKSQADEEREAREARSKQWGSLAEEERLRREKRDAEERGRRSAAWASDPDRFRGSAWERGDDLPASGGPDASRQGQPGREPERTSSSGSSTGGLSGRWRRRE